MPSCVGGFLEGSGVGGAPAAFRTGLDETDHHVFVGLGCGGGCGRRWLRWAAAARSGSWGGGGTPHDRRRASSTPGRKAGTSRSSLYSLLLSHLVGLFADVHLPGKKCFTLHPIGYRMIAPGSMDSLWGWGEILVPLFRRGCGLGESRRILSAEVNFLSIGRREASRRRQRAQSAAPQRASADCLAPSTIALPRISTCGSARSPRHPPGRRCLLAREPTWEQARR